MNIITVENIDTSPEDYDRVYFAQPITGFDLIDSIGYLTLNKDNELRIGSRVTLNKGRLLILS
jgi:hypothetical protein